MMSSHDVTATDVISCAAFAGSSLVAIILRRQKSSTVLLSTSFRRPEGAFGKQVHHSTASPPPCSPPPEPIRRVAVLGAGIGGLTMAHSLIANNAAETETARQDGGSVSAPSSQIVEVSVFEGRPTLEPNVGAGFVLNGGLATLGKINPDCQRAMIEAGNTIEGMEGRCKKPWWVRSTSSQQDHYKLFDIPLRKLIRKAGKETEAALLPNDQLMFTFIMRGACQEVLYDKLPDETKASVHFGKSLVGIEAAEDGSMCVFSDGTKSGPFDVIVGSDGIRSAVREYVQKGSISRNPDRRGGGFYTGLRISYAVEEGDDQSNNPDEEPSLATVNLGDGAFCLTPIFGTGKGRPNAKCVFSVYMDEDYFGPFRIRTKSRAKPIGANANKSVDEWRGMMLQQLRDYNVPDREPGKVIAKASRFFELGVYFHNPFSRWSKEVAGSDGSHVVLIGDAAHAMPPFLGQGANQTVQDAYSLGLLIKQYNDQVQRHEHVDFGALLKAHERTRKAVVSTIVYRTLLLGYLNLGGPYGIYSMFRNVIFRTMGLFQNVVMSAAMPKV